MKNLFVLLVICSMILSCKKDNPEPQLTQTINRDTVVLFAFYGCKTGGTYTCTFKLWSGLPGNSTLLKTISGTVTYSTEYPEATPFYYVLEIPNCPTSGAYWGETYIYDGGTLILQNGEEVTNPMTFYETENDLTGKPNTPKHYSPVLAAEVGLYDNPSTQTCP